jgi:hypothetical protein
VAELFFIDTGNPKPSGHVAKLHQKDLAIHTERLMAIEMFISEVIETGGYLGILEGNSLEIVTDLRKCRDGQEDEGHREIS